MRLLLLLVLLFPSISFAQSAAPRSDFIIFRNFKVIGGLTASVPKYLSTLHPGPDEVCGTVQSDCQTRSGMDVNIEYMSVCSDTTLPAGTTITYTLQVDGVDTSVSCTQNGGAADAACYNPLTPVTRAGCEWGSEMYGVDPLEISRGDLLGVSITCQGAGCPSSDFYIMTTNFSSVR